MLKTRIVPVLLWGKSGCVKGKQFKPRHIGSIVDRIRLMERRDIDELILLDVAATPEGRGPRFDEVKALCANLFCPVTVGGGIGSIEDIRRLLAGGADKVAINTVACNRPTLVDEAARKFGSQAVVGGIDVREGRVISHCGSRDTGRHPIDWATELENRGAGEILLTSVDRDGMMEGYDLDLIARVSSAVDIPVVCAGGCGSYSDAAAALDVGAHAVAVGAAFQFKEMTPKGMARYLRDRGYQVRV